MQPARSIHLASENADPKASTAAWDQIVIYRSPLSQLGKIILFLLSIPFMVWFSATFPQSVEHLQFTWRGELAFAVGVPMSGIVPILLLAAITHGLFNYKYVICDDYVIEIAGLISLSLRTTRLHYIHIKTVEVNKNILERILNIGDLVIAADMTQADSQINMRGVNDPHQYKDIIHERIRVKANGLSTLGLAVAG